MDLTTRRGEDGTGEVVNGTEQCRELNGTGSDVTGVVEVSRKTTSFSIRNLVGAEDCDRPADGNGNPSEAWGVQTLNPPCLWKRKPVPNSGQSPISLSEYTNRE
ncbi:jg17907 [Pararge aegeria aegeria]|uniref:Jg17907 protein n=1 Tax=Pararge aegeria aegeria TaxID=348720 RepID=A0A8S4SR67_9NEOP|nr:jg17907 [Pararge aegeria aegeria]